jgi:hypothetical protein
VRLREDSGSSPDTIDLLLPLFLCTSWGSFLGMEHEHVTVTVHEAFCCEKGRPSSSHIGLETACLLGNGGLHENWIVNGTIVNQAEAFARLRSRLIRDCIDSSTAFTQYVEPDRS